MEIFPQILEEKINKMEKKYLDDNEIWYYLCGFYPEIGKRIISPFRSNDKSPGTKFNICKFTNKVKFFDPSDSLRHGKSAIDMWCIQNNLEFKEAIQDIKIKLGASNKVGIKPKETVLKSKVEIKPIAKKLSKEGIEYWNKIGVTDMSNKAEVKAFKYVKEDSILEKPVDELTFLYLFDCGQWKSYSPYCKDKRFKFLGTVNKDNCWWFNENKYPTLFIAKSSKCYEVVKSLIVEFNIPISLTHWQSESIPNPYTKTKELTDISIKKALKETPNYSKILNYKTNITVFDNDDTGRTAAHYCNIILGSITPFVPVGKDITEFLEQTDRNTVVNWLLGIFNDTEKSADSLLVQCPLLSDTLEVAK